MLQNLVVRNHRELDAPVVATVVEKQYHSSNGQPFDATNPGRPSAASSMQVNCLLNYGQGTCREGSRDNRESGTFEGAQLTFGQKWQRTQEEQEKLRAKRKRRRVER